MEKSEKNIVEKKDTNMRIWLYSIVFIVFASLSVFLIFKYVDKKSSMEETINYSENGTIDYKVSLKDNDYYEGEFVEQNKIYIASLIDKIEIDFDYDFNIDRDIDCVFSYDIYSELIIKDGTSDREYIHKKYNVQSNVENIQNIKNYDFVKHVSIDYDYYNMLASKFKGDYGIDTESYLRVMFVLKKDNKDVTLNDSSMYVDIPLSERAISINTSPLGTNTYKQLVDASGENNSGIGYIIGLVFIIVMMVVVLFLLVSKLYRKRSKYQKHIAKLLREYDRMIVEVSSVPNLDDKERIIRISEFKELLDARDNLKLPIMYFERIKNKEALFFINDSEHLYLYVVKDREEV